MSTHARLKYTYTQWTAAQEKKKVDFIIIIILYAMH